MFCDTRRQFCSSDFDVVVVSRTRDCLYRVLEHITDISKPGHSADLSITILLWHSFSEDLEALVPCLHAICVESLEAEPTGQSSDSHRLIAMNTLFDDLQVVASTLVSENDAIELACHPESSIGHLSLLGTALRQFLILITNT